MSDAPGTVGTWGPLPSRRVVLLGAVVSTLSVAAAGCGQSADPPLGAAATTASPSAEVDQDVALLTRTIADEEGLLNFCTTAARRFPRQRALLGDLIATQREHVARLRSSLSGLRPPVTRTSPRVPRHVDDLVGALAQVFATAHSDRAADCLASASGPLGQLLGSVAASHAVTVQVLAPETAQNPVFTPGPVANAAPLQPCLAAEHAAVYGYSLLGGVLSAGVSDSLVAGAATASYTVHRDRRDLLVGLISGTGAQPVGSEPVYDTPFPVTGVPSARRLARYLEERCSGTYAAAIAATAGEPRELVSTTLVDCAVRAVRWGAVPTAFPGLGPT